MTTEIHEIAKRIVPVLRTGCVEASVFGSIARGDASQLSDLDLLVKYHEDVSLLDVVDLKNELESILGVKVDLVSSGLFEASSQRTGFERKPPHSMKKDPWVHIDDISDSIKAIKKYTLRFGAKPTSWLHRKNRMR